MSEFKERFPNNKHNHLDMMNMIGLLVCKIKRTTPKPISVKSRKSKPIEAGQIEFVQQAISYVVEKQIQFDSMCRVVEENALNDFFPQENQDTIKSIDKKMIDKATFDTIQKILNIDGLTSDIGFSR